MANKLSKEQLAKMMEASRKKREENNARRAAGEIIGAYVGSDEFDIKGEHYKLLYNLPEKNNLSVYRRTRTSTGQFIAIEVVIEKGPKKKYPKDEEFGERGWCYTGSEEAALKRVKRDFYLSF